MSIDSLGGNKEVTAEVHAYMEKIATAGKAKCNLCGKWITLVHRTKTNPVGRFRRHKMGDRWCMGFPLSVSK